MIGIPSLRQCRILLWLFARDSGFDSLLKHASRSSSARSSVGSTDIKKPLSAGELLDLDDEAFSDALEASYGGPKRDSVDIIFSSNGNGAGNIHLKNNCGYSNSNRQHSDHQFLAYGNSYPPTAFDQINIFQGGTPTAGSPWLSINGSGDANPFESTTVSRIGGTCLLIM